MMKPLPIALACLTLAACASDPNSGGDTSPDATDTALPEDAIATGDSTGDTADGDASGDATDSDASEVEDGPWDVDTAVDPDVAVGDPDVLVGSFVLTLVPPVYDDEGALDTAGTTSIVGRVNDGPTPSLVGYDLADSVADCALYLPVIPHCDQLCGGSAACVAEDVCQAYPKAKSLGTVTVFGVETAAGANRVTMTAIGGNYQPGGASLPYPAFAEGDAIAVSTSGGDYAPFAIRSTGIAPLDLVSTDILVDRDTPIALAWAPAGDDAASHIEVKLDISHHGGTKGVIRCTTDDDGALEIDAALVTQLVDLGVSGLPTIVVARSTVASRTIEPGRVDLVATSVIERGVVIPGLVSCNDDGDCPEGQTCQDDLKCE